MYRFIRSNVIGFVALFVALGGGAYAVTVKKNSVKSSSIKDGSVLARDLGADSVDGSKVADNSITGGDVNESSLSIGGPTRVGFHPTGCTAVNPCNETIDLGAGIRVRAHCDDNAGGAVEASLEGAWASFNLSLIVDGATDFPLVYGGIPSGGDNILSLDAQNAVGTLVVQGTSGAVVTVPFHAYAGGANCVFEGTATAV